MEEPLADGVIVVHGGRREVFLGFVEGDEEHVEILLPEIQDTLAFTVNIDLFRSPVAGHGEDLVAEIRAVQGEPGGEPEIERAFEDFGFVFKVGEETVDLSDIEWFVAGLAGLADLWRVRGGFSWTSERIKVRIGRHPFHQNILSSPTLLVPIHQRNHLILVKQN